MLSQKYTAMEEELSAKTIEEGEVRRLKKSVKKLENEVGTF